MMEEKIKESVAILQMAMIPRIHSDGCHTPTVTRQLRLLVAGLCYSQTACRIGKGQLNVFFVWK